jgi:uncharacterized protein
MSLLCSGSLDSAKSLKHEKEAAMELSGKTKLQELLQAYPFLLEFFLNRSPKFQMLKSSVMRRTVGKVAPLSHIAERGEIDLDQLLKEVAAAVKAETGDELLVHSTRVQEAETAPQDGAARQEVLKDIIRDLHAGVDMSILKRRFHALIKDIDGPEIARLEQRLIAEGMPQSEIKRLCDVHVELFKESLETKETPVVPPGHPLHTYMLENRAAEKIAGEISQIIKQLDSSADAAVFDKFREPLLESVNRLAEINLHYLRKENQLFPALERHEITGPSEVMWGIHDDIRQTLKQVRSQIETAQLPLLYETLAALLQSVGDMIYKEEHILFPMALEILPAEEWGRVRQGEEEIGYAWVQPEAGWNAGGAADAVTNAVAGQREIDLDTGRMTPELVNLMLKHLPVDLSFVNENDETIYYSQTKERIFPRSPGVIGRKVQNCHPPKSMHIVQKILDEFRAGTRDSAEFWIPMGGRFIHIRYFAVRDADGAYKGTLEVSQDVTGIRSLEGEQRLLDWD